MSREIRESVLFRTSSASSVQCGGGLITIPGLKSTTPLSAVSSITQTKYRAEVPQVVTVAGTSYAPRAATKYTVWVYDPLRTQAGYQEMPLPFSFTTPDDLTTIGANAAAQREAIHADLVAKINSATGLIHATAVSLGGGTGFTVTDSGGYYPVWSQTMTNVRGINTVVPITNSDGTGFASTNVATTTAGVYSSGVGAKLAQMVPVIDAVHGNLISGVLLDPPVTIDGLPAVSGQNYDLFVINSLQLINAIGITDQYLYQQKTQYIWVDNGTGSSTTNLTGFKAFARQMRKIMSKLYQNDPSAVIEWFDTPIVFQDPLGAAPTGTANTLGWQMSPYSSLNRTNIGTQTIVAPVLAAAGLLLDQDDTAGDGSHTSANQQTLGDQQFTVGQTAFMVMCTVVAADWTDTQFLVGFRRKAVYTADYNDYTDLAAIGGGAADGDSVTTFGILNNAATVATDTTVNFADGVSAFLVVKVAIDGTVTCQINGTTYPVYSVGTTALVLDATDIFIPFYQHVNIGNGDPAVTISEFVAIATDSAVN